MVIGQKAVFRWRRSVDADPRRPLLDLQHLVASSHGVLLRPKGTAGNRHEQTLAPWKVYSFLVDNGAEACLLRDSLCFT